MRAVAATPVAHRASIARGVTLGACVGMLACAAASAVSAAELQVFCANGLKAVDFLASPAAAPAIETAGMHPGSS